MNIKPSDKTIKQLLLSGKQFVIPRFQREYSWEKKNYQEFIEDMIDSLHIENGVISHDQYFLGTMLFYWRYSRGVRQRDFGCGWTTTFNHDNNTFFGHFR